ncbi:TetR/AcrR family transcriptional regulator [Rhizobium sp. TH2]|uniref:TetR/AcrR family transcriptional regulator n=1 Tax=Rhizobium sp. TH2 TaxID=2775403 RepID=UPI0021583AEF|nr:TetR/AcrR family transcriptional regulator [Rhizobium sp. TH2]UVC10217.1 TetR/AcrR family transcriptional regulator [Rhizobium sp. TH2]
MTPVQHESRTKLLDAALDVFRAKGYTATRVEDICAAAGLTKGSFFHHFKTKDELAIAAAGRWTEVTGALFHGADYHKPTDPVDRVLGYIEFRKQLLRGSLAEYTCLLGTLIQEVYDTNPPIRIACEASISSHVATLVDDIEAAKTAHAPGASWSTESLALHMQAVIQGSYIIAKARYGADPAAESIEHLKRYVAGLFGRSIQ